MQHQEFEPPEELKNSISCLWYLKRESNKLLSEFEVTPDGFAEIIFHFGGDLRMSHNGTLKSLPSPFMVGLLNQPVLFYSENELEIIGVRCFPWTVFEILNLPSGRDGVRLLKHPIAELQSTLDQFFTSGHIQKAMDHIIQYFMNAQTGIAVDTMLFKAGVAMMDAKGSLPVTQIAEAAHVTLRTLERKFKKSSGYTVKDVSGLIRFEQVRNQLWQNPDSGLAGLAYEAGYTDQSHLSREFKRYSGITPAVFARKVKKWKLSVSDDFVAFIQA